MWWKWLWILLLGNKKWCGFGPGAWTPGLLHKSPGKQWNCPEAVVLWKFKCVHVERPHGESLGLNEERSFASPRLLQLQLPSDHTCMSPSSRKNKLNKSFPNFDPEKMREDKSLTVCTSHYIVKWFVVQRYNRNHFIFPSKRIFKMGEALI